MSFSQSFCKNILHLSGAMLSLSLRICYVLKDIPGIFQPGFISFGWERKNVWLRLKNRSTEIEKTFGWELFTAFRHGRSLKDAWNILQDVIYCMTVVCLAPWKMKDIFAKTLGGGGVRGEREPLLHWISAGRFRSRPQRRGNPIFFKDKTPWISIKFVSLCLKRI